MSPNAFLQPATSVIFSLELFLWSPSRSHARLNNRFLPLLLSYSREPPCLFFWYFDPSSCKCSRFMVEVTSHRLTVFQSLDCREPTRYCSLLRGPLFFFFLSFFHFVLYARSCAQCFQRSPPSCGKSAWRYKNPFLARNPPALFLNIGCFSFGPQLFPCSSHGFDPLI